MSLSINGSSCVTRSNVYPNKPCVSVTICIPGTTTCETVNDILLDTGSVGLRVFKSALNGLALTPMTSGSKTIATCAQFGDGSEDWGPVEQASVSIGSEPAVTTPIQVIDSTYVGASNCGSSPESSPTVAGLNGILGVDLYAQDCGEDCVEAAEGLYFSCGSTSCSGTTLALASQLQNPVALFPYDNNGVIITLPSVSTSGVSSTSGTLTFGIGTRTNNTPPTISAPHTYIAEDNAEYIEFAEMNTVFAASTLGGFIDSGSNGLYFPITTSTSYCSPALAACSGSSWYCPSSLSTCTATNAGTSGNTSAVSVSFQVGSYGSFNFSTNNVFPTLGANSSGEFDWGLPFFFGKTIYFGYEGKSSSLGSGKYWAF
jgi:hypothetical protein